VLVATYQTYSTGKSIKNLHNIVYAEDRLDEKIISQSMGRGMRLHHSKDKFKLVDLIDNFDIDNELYSNKCIMMKHGSERKRQYIKDGLSVKSRKVTINRFQVEAAYNSLRMSNMDL
jgi:hypothetical protein